MAMNPSKGWVEWRCSVPSLERRRSSSNYSNSRCKKLIRPPRSTSIRARALVTRIVNWSMIPLRTPRASICKLSISKTAEPLPLVMMRVLPGCRTAPVRLKRHLRSFYSPRIITHSDLNLGPCHHWVSNLLKWSLRTYIKPKLQRRAASLHSVEIKIRPRMRLLALRSGTPFRKESHQYSSNSNSQCSTWCTTRVQHSTEECDLNRKEISGERSNFVDTDINRMIF